MKRVTFSNGTRVTVNAGIAELIELLGNETIRRGYAIRSGVTGGYNCRAISGGSSYSNHAWGLAVDINWDRNPMGRPLRTDMPKWMIDLWVGYGFRWGGTYSRPDSMHYEFMGTRTDANAQTVRARANLLGQKPTTPPTKGPRMLATRHRRLLDTRTDGNKRKVGNGEWVAVKVPSSKPPWAQAMLLNVTLLDSDNPKAGMHAQSIWQADKNRPASTANLPDGMYVNPNTSLYPFNGDEATIKVVGGPCHMIVDFQGWAEADI